MALFSICFLNPGSTKENITSNNGTTQKGEDGKGAPPQKREGGKAAPPTNKRGWQNHPTGAVFPPSCGPVLLSPSPHPPCGRCCFPASFGVVQLSPSSFWVVVFSSLFPFGRCYFIPSFSFLGGAVVPSHSSPASSGWCCLLSSSVWVVVLLLLPPTHKIHSHDIKLLWTKT